LEEGEAKKGLDGTKKELGRMKAIKEEVVETNAEQVGNKKEGNSKVTKCSQKLNIKATEMSTAAQVSDSSSSLKSGTTTKRKRTKAKSLLSKSKQIRK
jgi:hypothetical protein